MQRPLAVHLLGTPTVRRASAEQPAPRGRKAWALLAYLLTTDAARSRQWLAELLFTEAEDLLNTLSWNLGQLRLLLGAGGPPGRLPGPRWQQQRCVEELAEVDL